MNANTSTATTAIKTPVDTAGIEALLVEPEKTPEQLRMDEQMKQRAAKKRARKGEKWKAFVENRDGGVV